MSAGVVRDTTLAEPGPKRGVHWDNWRARGAAADLEMAATVVLNDLVALREAHALYGVALKDTSAIDHSPSRPLPRVVAPPLRARVQRDDEAEIDCVPPRAAARARRELRTC